MVLEGKTKTGALDFKMAAAACYLPVSFIHFIAAGLFLASEPKEHRFVRFHAIQSLFLALFFLGGSTVLVVGGMLILPLILIVFGSVAGGMLGAVSQDLGELVIALAMGLSALSYMIGGLLGVGMSLGFLPAFLLTAAMVMSGKVARWPVFGGMAERFV